MNERANKNNRNIKPFDGSKYNVWKYRVSLLLDEENVMYVLEDELPEKPDIAWIKSEKVAKRIIVEHLDDSMLTFFKKSDSARNIIKKFDELYERQSLTIQLTIEKSLLSLKFKEETSLTNHFLIFEQMLQDVSAAGSVINERNKISRLLLTLPRSYDPIITAIQTTLPDNLNLSLVKTNLLEYEAKLNNERKDTSNKVLQINANNSQPFYNKNQNNNYNKNRNNNYNKYHNNNYNKKQNMSYNKNYNNRNQQSYKQRNKQKNPNKTFYNKNNIKCENCGRRNHNKQNCYYKLKINDNNERTQVQTAILEENAESFLFMSDAQHNINQHKNTSNNITFLLDSGATDHVINRDDVFDKKEVLKDPIVIKVAKKDAYITATKKKKITVGSILRIHPELT